MGLLCGPLSCGRAPNADQKLLNNLVSLIFKFFEGKPVEYPLSAEFFKEIRVNFFKIKFDKGLRESTMYLT